MREAVAEDFDDIECEPVADLLRDHPAPGAGD